MLAGIGVITASLVVPLVHLSLSIAWLDPGRRPPDMTSRDLTALHAVGLVTAIPVLIAVLIFLASSRLPLLQHRRIAGSILLACGVLSQFYLLGFILLNWSH